MPIAFDAVSFAGCGTLNFYQVGVLAALQLSRKSIPLKYAGASAGAGLSVLAASNIDAYRITDVAAKVLGRHAGKNIVTSPKIPIEFGQKFLSAFEPELSLEALQGRVAISITKLRPFRNQLVSQFESIPDLLSAIRASCHLPSLSLPYIRFRGQPCVDGGMTWNSPIIGSNCLRVSPLWLDSRTDISPSKKISPWWGIHVPSVPLIWKLFELGKQDGRNYIYRLEKESLGPLKKHTRILGLLRGPTVP